MGLFSGKVVLVTGAGNGIGRAHALAFAREGAAVVVNDLGGSRDGGGNSEGPAAEVVGEIQAMGGQAIANRDSVTDAEGCRRMVADALDRWGRLDVVVNNAGIIRDRTFARLTDEQWDSVVEVHLKGTYNVTRAALPALQKQGGAIINTTSLSGLIGNFGQSNYAAAKAGIYGMSRVLSMELQRAGITVNCVAPIAKTRMTEELAMVAEDWRPEQISPIVLFLASELGKSVTGKVFGVQGQRIHVYEMKVNDGVEKPGSDLWTPAEIAEKLDQILAWEQPKAEAVDAGPVAEAFGLLPLAFQPDRAGPEFRSRLHFAIKDGPSYTLVVEKGTARTEAGLNGVPDATLKTDSETIVGLMKQSIDAQKAFMSGKISADNLGPVMKFAMYFDFSARPAAVATPSEVSEKSEAKTYPIGKIYDGGFAFAEPAHAAAYAAATGDSSPAYQGPDSICPPMFHVRLLKELIFKIATDPELGLDMLRLVHGQHDATFLKPIRPWDLVQMRGRLVSVEEKSSGLLVTSRLSCLVDGDPAVEATTAYFIRGTKKAEKGAPAAPPTAAPPPDYSAAIHVADDQSLRYADASLDNNPIHTDPATAKAAGLPGVILQGLCTMAMSGAALVAGVADNDARRLSRLSVRFASPVLNGSELRVQAWKASTTKGKAAWALETRNAAGALVISNGVAEIRE